MASVTREGEAVRQFTCLIAAAILLHPVAGYGDNTTYKYRDDDGTLWLTDRPASGAQLQELEFVGYHGRPPARLTCGDLPEGEVEARADAISTPLREHARRVGVEYELARAIVAAESCFDPEAVSVVGAQGLMQLMPQTAAALGVDDPFNIHENLRAGTEYLRELRERYDGDVILALAAYNAGPRAVDRHGGIPPFEETETYVDRVLDYWGDFRRQGD